MTAKNPAAKNPAKAPKQRKPRTAKASPAAALPEPGYDESMKAFHQADAIARMLYPTPVWDPAKEIPQLRMAIITAMNMYNVGYFHSLSLVRELTREAMSAMAVKFAMGELPEEEMNKEAIDIFAIADSIGMPLTPRAAYVRSQNDIIATIRVARPHFTPHDRPLNMQDLQNYYFSTYFASSPVAMFVSPPEAVVDIATTLIIQGGPSAFLEFSDREVILHPLTSNLIPANPVWQVAQRLLDVLTQLVHEVKTPDVRNEPTVEFLKKVEGVPYEIASQYLLDFLVSMVAPKTV